MQQTQEIQVQSLGQEDLLEKKIAMHSSIFACEIPWTEEPGWLQSMGAKAIQWALSFQHVVLGKPEDHRQNK